MPGQAWKTGCCRKYREESGEADAMKQGHFVHPEVNIQIRRKQSDWHAGGHCACSPTTKANSSCFGPGAREHCLYSVFWEQMTD